MLLTSFLIVGTSIVGWEFGRKIGRKIFNRAADNNQQSVEVIDAEVVEEGPYRTNALTSAERSIILPELSLLPKTKKPKRIQWAWSSFNKRFICPKCSGLQNSNYQPPYCDCDSTEHFHFECCACKFNGLMETADKSK